MSADVPKNFLTTKKIFRPPFSNSRGRLVNPPSLFSSPQNPGRALPTLLGREPPSGRFAEIDDVVSIQYKGLLKEV